MHALLASASALTFGLVRIEGGPYAGHPRTIEGTAALWGRNLLDGKGRRHRLEGPAALAFTGKVAVVADHDLDRPVGRVVAFTDVPAGRLVRALLDQGPEADDLLRAALQGSAAFSMHCVPVKARWRLEHGEWCYVVTEGRWAEVTVTTMPAIPECTVTRVAGRRVRSLA
jgi:hypothetical protein